MWGQRESGRGREESRKNTLSSPATRPTRPWRKKKPVRASSSSSAQTESANTDSPITVTLREGKRDQWSQTARTSEITAHDIGGEGNKKVYIRESVTLTTSYLLWKAKTDLKDKSLCKYVWCKNGIIMSRIADGDKKIYYVRAEKDIYRIAKELETKERTKWRTSKGPTLRAGAVVLVWEDCLPPYLWRLGRIIGCCPGRNGVARVAEIQTARGIIKRAFNNICPLPIDAIDV